MDGTTLQTLFLNPSTWDLCVDSAGNIALAGPPYATAQDAASYCRTELGECYYDDTLGVPIRVGQFDQAPAGSPPIQNPPGLPPLTLVEAQYAAAAATVPGVAQAVALLSFSRQTRAYSGQVQVTDAAGQSAGVQLPEAA